MVLSARRERVRVQSRVEVEAVLVESLARPDGAADTDGLDDGPGRSRHLDGSAFAAVFEYYRRPLARAARRRGSVDGEGIAGLAMVETWLAFDGRGVDDEATFRAALDRAVERLTAEDGCDDRVTAVPLPDDSAPDPPLTEDPAQAIVDRAWLQELVADLPPDQRDVMELRFFEQLPAREVGERLGKEANAVYQLQHRAIARLRRTIGGPASTGGAAGRRARFLAAVFCLTLVLGAIGWHRLQRSDGAVDVGPIDRTTDSVGDDEEEGRRGSGDGTGDDRSTVQVDVGGAMTVDLGDQTTGSGDPHRPGDGSDDGGSNGRTSPGQAAGGPVPGGGSIGDDDPVGTTRARSTPPFGRAIGQAHRCQTLPVDDDLAALRLFDHVGWPIGHDRSVVPIAVRFLGSNGSVLLTIPTDGGYAAGASPGLHGLIGPGEAAEEGVFADVGSAPSGSTWGVLFDPETAGRWSRVEYRLVDDEAWTETRESCLP